VMSMHLDFCEQREAKSSSAGDAQSCASASNVQK